MPSRARRRARMNDCLIALGSNTGNRAQNIVAAIELLQQLPESRWIAASDVLENPAIGPRQADYLNAVARLVTELDPQQLMHQLGQIEAQLGRQRRRRWDPRPIDLDLLIYADQIIHGGGLRVPHPRMSFRRFVLAPAVQVAGELIHPPSGLSLATLLQRLDRLPDNLGLLARGPRAPLELLDALRRTGRVDVDLVPLLPEQCRTDRPWSAWIASREEELMRCAPHIKLAVLVPDQPDAVPRFPGAVLNLSGMPVGAAAAELSAALAATRPIDAAV